MPGILDALAEAMSDIGSLEKLALPDQVAKFVPSSAKYVTLASGMLMEDINNMSSSTLRDGRITETTILSGGVPVENLGQSKLMGYLWHDNSNLEMTNDSGTLLSVPILSIVSFTPGLGGNQGGGFRISLNDGSGYIFGQFARVQLPEGVNYRTSPNPTNGFYGWDNELASVGVTITKPKYIVGSGVIFMMIFALVFIVFSIFILFHH